MADNVGYTPGTGATVSADEVTYSGDTSLVQLVRPVLVSGTEGSRTVVDLPGDNTNGLDVDVTRVSGNVTVVQSTAANLKTDANITNTSVPIGDGTNTVTIDTDPADGEPNSGNALHAESRTYIYNGTTWDRVRGDITNGMDVDVTRVQGNLTVVGAAADGATLSGNPVLIAGSDGTNAQTLSVTATGELNVDAVGNIAHDTADSGAPVKLGTRARSTVIGSVATDDRADAIGTLQGYVITYPYALPQSSLTGTASSTGTGDTAVIAAQGAGITVNVTTITIYNDSTTNTFVNIKDGTTTRLVVPAPAKGGAMVTLPSPLRITANTALNFASASAVTTMYVSAVGFAGI